MSSSSRRTNNDHSAPRGSGRSSNSVRRTSSQPPQQFQPPATASGRLRGDTAASAWANPPPSSNVQVQGSASGQAPLYANNIQLFGDDTDYRIASQLTGLAQPTLPISVPELYPPTGSTFASTSSGQYGNPQSHGQLSSFQHPTTWTGDTRDLSPSQLLQPVSLLARPQNTSVPHDVVYSTQPQYQPPNGDSSSRNYPPQRRQQQQPSPPKPLTNQYLGSDQMPPLLQPVVSPSTQEAPLYATDRQYSSPPSSSQYTRTNPTRTNPTNYDNGRRPVAHHPTPNSNPNRQGSSIQPTGPVAGERTPNEWGYQPTGTLPVSNALRNAPPVVAPRPVVPTPTGNTRQRGGTMASVSETMPICLIAGCRNPVLRDLETNELTEYCGEAHMNQALRTLGVLVCPACKRYPRRTGREYCGSSCEQWAQQQQRQQQPQRQGQQQQRLGQQQQHQVQPQQHQVQQQQHQVQQQRRQVQQQPTAAANPYPPVSNSGSVTWSNVAVGPTPPNSITSPRVRRDQPW